MNAPVLVELLTEELPPKSLRKLAEAFGQTLVEQLAQQGLVPQPASFVVFATPRRLAVKVEDVAAQAPDQRKREKVLPVTVAFDASGKPSAPLLKKLGALGLSEADLPNLVREHDGKQDVLYADRVVAGVGLTQGLQQALAVAAQRLPIPRMMNYQLPQGDTVQFVRPAHRLIALHGAEVVPLQLLGLQAGRSTLGHRFMSSGEISIPDAGAYAQVLREQGRVVAAYDERRQTIQTALAEAARGATVVMPQALLDEVTSLVEWPVVYEGNFDPAFLEVPQECLILTMQQNQKYFALTDGEGRMLSRFLLVSNLASTDPRVVTSGNERVLRARLADARFFFQQDRKRSLASRVEGLATVVYHNKLGSQLDRVDRVARLAAELATSLGVDVALVRRAAALAKADLLTDMVGEFPELQGVMGTYYARHDGENDQVALAMTEQYQPRFAGDALPSSQVGTVLALADKLETLVGIWGIGLAPTGEKDPFALRRHALGVVRMIIEKGLPLNVSEALTAAYRAFAQVNTIQVDQAGVANFLRDRLKSYLRDRAWSPQEIESVLSLGLDRLDDCLQRLEAVRAFGLLPESVSLAAANKRIANILKKNNVETDTAAVDASCLVVPAERALYEAVVQVEPEVQAHLRSNQYTASLTLLARLRAEVDAFFDGVMVMDEDLRLRQNRLALLGRLHRLMNQVADLAKLAA